MNQFQPDFSSANSAVPRESEPAGDIDLHRLANLLRARARLIALVACAPVVAALIYVICATRIYESRAVIQVHQEPQKVVNILEVAEEKPETSDYLNTVVQAFTSRKLMLRVIRAIGLDKDASFAPPKSDGSGYAETELADRLSKIVNVSLRRGTRLVDLKVFHEKPETAKVLAATFVNEFRQEAFEQRRELSRLAYEYLHQEAEELKSRLEQSERKLQSYKEETKAVSLDQRQDVTVEKLKETNTAATDAKSLRLRLEADLEQIKGINPKDTAGLLKISSVSKIPQVALIREKLLDAESELADLKERYLQKNPKLIAARTKVANLKAELADILSKAGDTLEREYESAREAEQKLSRSLEDQEQKALELNKIAIPFNVLQREVESDRALFQSITQRLKETSITGGVDGPAFRVIEEPLVAAFPAKPRKKLILGLAIMLGITFGVGTVIGMDAIDGSLRTLDQAESYLELPVLAAIPDDRKLEVIDTARQIIRERPFSATRLLSLAQRVLPKMLLRSSNGNNCGESANKTKRVDPLLVLAEPACPQAEAFRTLRASVSLLSRKVEFQSFLFTSAIPFEGKTFTSINFASTLAQHGRKTLIIDADLRESKVEEVLLNYQKPGNPGLTDLLRAEISFAKALQPTTHANLFLLPAGRQVADPGELLDSENFSRILRHLSEDFDRIIVDSPPVNAVSDVLLIAGLVQATCLIVRAGKTHKKPILRALHQLELANANVIGLIFNRLPIGGHSAGYYYYHYGSRYKKNSRSKEALAAFQN